LPPEGRRAAFQSLFSHTDGKIRNGYGEDVCRRKSSVKFVVKVNILTYLMSSDLIGGYSTLDFKQPIKWADFRLDALLADKMLTKLYICCFFFLIHLIVGVEESIVNALYRLRITDQLFKCYILHEWCVHNRLFYAYYEVKF
jgi:hypothetical protein